MFEWLNNRDSKFRDWLKSRGMDEGDVFAYLCAGLGALILTTVAVCQYYGIQ
ncbi:MAG: hypothetical protein WCT32_00385 [Patescibacteria group bacterium]